VRGDRARDHVELVAQAVFTAAIDQQLARRAQRLETTAQVRDLPLTGNPQRCSHGRQGQGNALLPESVEERIGVRNGMPVRGGGFAGARRNCW
jgi:hypothetical protein